MRIIWLFLNPLRTMDTVRATAVINLHLRETFSVLFCLKSKGQRAVAAHDAFFALNPSILLCCCCYGQFLFMLAQKMHRK